MEPKIVSRPAFTVVGRLYHGKNEHGEIPKLWDQSPVPWADEIRDQVMPPLAYGVLDHIDPQTGEFDYLAGYGVERVVDLPEGMIRWDVPAQTYAVFTCTLPTIMDGFAAARRWFEQSGTQRAAGPEFEFYDEHFMAGDATLYIYMPIVRV
ncbi:MAG: GyrI-like domain-containing protein [Anaerolineae bacterium]|nr:GyrI-like domain-containing protein [Anaerolineae bacterium]